ncbi:MAG: Gfo/Idh/MocA family oxidoreductase [Firmicutes bacterium]|nr:Gfo/Idh/MocA family oxidoreductase [Bacillota bacterium]
MEKVRFGLIGMGNIGIHHFSYFPELEDAELTAICDIDPAKLKELKVPGDFDQAIAAAVLDDKIAKYTDYRAMLDSGKVDTVIIAAPHYFHPEMAVEAFRRGIHVICEKPVAITGRQAREMNAAHADSQVVYAAMFQMRTNPVYRKIKEMLEDGTLGEVRRVSWIITDWFRTQAYYDSGGWRGNWTGEGGGVLMNQCPHNLDLFQWFFGLPKRLHAVVHLGKWHDITVEDDVSVLMELANGATASFITSTGDTPGTNRLEITAERGKLVLEEGRLTFFKTEDSVQRIIEQSEVGFYSVSPKVMEIQIEAEPHGHKYITQNTVNAILGKEPLIAPGTEGLDSVQLANAILLSGIRGRTVEVPVCEDEFDELLEELRADERRHAPDKVFDWEAYINSFAS